MIVRDLDDAWQVVLQTDHADLSAAFARAWSEPLSPSLVTAAERPERAFAGWPFDARRLRTDSAKRSRIGTVSLHEMQASVMLCP